MLAAISSTSDLKITITITNTLKKEYEVFFDSLLLINIETTTGQPVQYIGPQFDVENPYTSDSLYKKIKPDETLTLGPVDCSFGFELTKGTTYVVQEILLLLPILFQIL
eukprot:gene7802-12276_t